LIASTSHKDNILYEMFRFYAGGITGMWMIFTIFRLFYTPRLSQITHHALEYVGTRTLDIYLLHYFFLPRFLMTYSPQLHTYNSSLLEFLVIMLISLIVLLLSLLASYVLRLSPFLARYLFGVRK
jgi:surface polysaccharide O-acyltransferase-like enzyme